MPLLKTIPTPKEPTFELDSFDQPLEISGPDVWIRDLVSIALYEPGTFSEDSSIGAYAQNELFNFADNAVSIIQSKLSHACSEYLSDVPIENLSVLAYNWEEKGTTVLVINCTFESQTGSTTYAAYISTIDSQLSYIISQL